ncbi:MFS transporter [Microcoleus vaginatus GB1-A2]|uniref:MFS transporter n=1 Tax=Microcoleus vaginatus TaxID=119532 RepID=UPI001688E90A|nr:MFS transporter [Microcoleus sp. FACHB-61]
MYQNLPINPQLYNIGFWLAQVPVEQTTTNRVEDAALLYSGPQFFIALIAGVVLACAFQLLLTNLSVAAGLSYMGQSHDDGDHHSDSGSSPVRHIGRKVGTWTLITVTVALFFACLLAVKLSLISSPGLGAIVGLVVWATYFSMLVWVSSTTVGSLIGSVVNSATSGFQAILGTAASAIGAKAASNQVVATAKAAAAAVGHELGSAIDPTSLRENVEDYIQSLKPPELDIKGMRSEFEKLLNDPQLKTIATENLPNLDRQTLVDLVSSRSDLSKRDVNRIVDQLQDAWKQVGKQGQQSDGIAQLVDYLKSAKSGDLVSDTLASRVEKVLSNLGGNLSGQNSEQSPTMMSQATTMAVNALMGIVLGRTDISDLDLEKVVGQLKEAKDKVTQQTDKITAQVKGEPVTYSPIRADVENYLLNTYSWQMNPQAIEREFRDVLYDPTADPGTVRRELEKLKQSNFAEILASRGVFTQDKIKQISQELEAIRQRVLQTVIFAEEQEKSRDLQWRVETYLKLTPKEELTAAGIGRDFKKILEDSDASYEQLRDRLSPYTRDSFVQILRGRENFGFQEVEQIVQELERTRDVVLADAKGLQEAAQARLDNQWQRVQEYLKSTGKEELNPEGIKRDLKTLLDNPEAGMWALRARASKFDRQTLVKLLSQRKDLSEDQVNQLIDSAEENWHSALHAPQKLAEKAKDQYDNTTTALADYLRNTGKSELNPEGIKRDLTKLLENPKEGALALRGRLSQVDRDTLVKLLSQRQDLSEEQVNQIIDQVQETLGSIVKAPRRLAKRMQSQVQDFQSVLEDYLRNTGKDELNPEAIKRDLQLLLHDPKVGAYSLGERLSHIDRATVVSLLSQRPDISEAEANRIVDGILSVRDEFALQIQKIQEGIQSVIDGILGKVRDYLNSLDRPELNYEGITRDVRKLFDDPQAGFDALRDRLGHFNRDTLVALISSREDISEADANRLIDQIERSRNSVLQRAERLQQEAQLRLESIKLQAEKQAEETRKAAEVASWWLFFTALSSAAAAAGAGALAVIR